MSSDIVIATRRLPIHHLDPISGHDVVDKQEARRLTNAIKTGVQWGFGDYVIDRENPRARLGKRPLRCFRQELLRTSLRLRTIEPLQPIFPAD